MLRLHLVLSASLVAAMLAACSSPEPDEASPGATSTTESGDPAYDPGQSQGGGEEGAEDVVSGEVTGVYGEPTSWMCHPALDDTANQCLDDLDLTVVHTDGTTEIVEHNAAEDPDIDCFYLYSTISTDPLANSDLVPSDSEEGRALQNQAARLNSVCEVWAPVYRQATLTGTFGGAGGDGEIVLGGDGVVADGAGGVVAESADGVVVDGADGVVEEEQVYLPDPAYSDALDAWNTYLAQSEPGRGVVLVGSSQGAGLLKRLIAEEIDDNDALRGRLVSALLLGTNVSVPEGKDVGGDFDNVPLCRQGSQIGCVVSFGSYRSTAPPAPIDTFDGMLHGVCVNPAAPSGGVADLDAVFSTSTERGWWPSWQPWNDPGVYPEITTAFYSMPGMVTGECVSEGGNPYLRVTVNSDPTDPRVDDIGGDLPGQGLHLVDANLTMGDQVALVGAQAEAYAK